MELNGYIIVGLFCAFIAGGINSRKGRSYIAGFTLGLLLNFLGVIIVALLPKDEAGLERVNLQDGTSKKCPYCAEIIKQEAIVCKHCGRDLPIQEKLQELERPAADPEIAEIQRVETLGIEVVACPKCGTYNSLSLTTCEKCNTNINSVKPIQNPYL